MRRGLRPGVGVTGSKPAGEIDVTELQLPPVRRDDFGGAVAADGARVGWVRLDGGGTNRATLLWYRCSWGGSGHWQVAVSLTRAPAVRRTVEFGRPTACRPRGGSVAPKPNTPLAPSSFKRFRRRSCFGLCSTGAARGADTLIELSRTPHYSVIQVGSIPRAEATISVN